MVDLVKVGANVAEQVVAPVAAVAAERAGVVDDVGIRLLELEHSVRASQAGIDALEAVKFKGGWFNSMLPVGDYRARIDTTMRHVAVVEEYGHVNWERALVGVDRPFAKGRKDAQLNPLANVRALLDPIAMPSAYPTQSMYTDIARAKGLLVGVRDSLHLRARDLSHRQVAHGVTEQVQATYRSLAIERAELGHDLVTRARQLEVDNTIDELMDTGRRLELPS